jgi:hypothetical protein
VKFGDEMSIPQFQPLALEDDQLDRIIDAAALLPRGMRSDFLRAVANTVAGKPNVTACDVEAAITTVLSAYGVATGRARRR